MKGTTTNKKQLKQTKANKSKAKNMCEINMNASMMHGMEAMLEHFKKQVVESLSEKYDFEFDDAMKSLPDVVIEKSKSKSKAKKPEKPKVEKPKVPLPFCGQVNHDWCQAIVSNNKLYTQCTSAKVNGNNFCRRCLTSALKNDGAMPYGVIQDRLKGDYKDKDGNAPVKYGNVLKAKKIDPEEAKAEAAKFGLTIPEEEFEVIVKKKGRKPNKAKVEVSDTDDDMFAEAKKQAEETKCSETESDSDSSDDDEPIMKPNNKRKTKSKGPTKKLTLSADAETSGSSSDELKSAKKKQRTPEDENKPEDEKHINEELDLEEYDESESDCESDTGYTVSPIEYEGKTYNVDENGNVYDEKGAEKVGVQHEDGTIEFYDDE